MMRFLARILLLLPLWCGHAAAVSVAKIFSDSMVLQRDRPIPIWGKGTPDADVVVGLAGQKHATRVDAQGRWRLEFPPLAANGRGLELSIHSGETTLVLRDVLIGEVWFAGGQSNMAHSMGSSARKLPEFAQLIREANKPQIRIRKVNERNSPTLKDDLAGGVWVVASPAHVKNFSAVAYLFARRLHQELGVPIGVIEAAWGGTPIEPHIPSASFTGHPTLEKLRALGAKKDLAAIHAMPGGTFARSEVWLAGQIFNGRVAPVAPYAIRGAIWYQGESNCGHAEDPREYAVKMGALVNGWRNAWKNPELPFYFIQLPQWKSPAWPYLREEQRKAAEIPLTGMAVTIDLDFHDDIHPPNKLDVAERLARWPLAKEYERELDYRSPSYREHTIKDGVVSVAFHDAEEGLVIGRSSIGTFRETSGTALNGFEICAEDGTWHEASAQIADGWVRVAAPTGISPTAVRYACQPMAPLDRPWNLFSRTGLPAEPFCSDWTRMTYEPAMNGH